LSRNREIPPHPGSETGLEVEVDPGSVLAQGKVIVLPLDFEGCRPAVCGEFDRERETQGLFLLQNGIGRTGQDGFGGPVGELKWDYEATRDPTAFLGVAAEVGEGALGSPEVGNRHGRQEQSLESLGGEGDRDPKDGAENAVIPQDLPEGLALPLKPDPRFPDGNSEPADLDVARRRIHPGRAEFGKVGLPVGDEEVEYPVTSRIAPGLKGGPCNR
jgi:hypothetical protein